MEVYNSCCPDTILTYHSLEKSLQHTYETKWARTQYITGASKVLLLPLPQVAKQLSNVIICVIVFSLVSGQAPCPVQHILHPRLLHLMIASACTAAPHLATSISPFGY